MSQSFIAAVAALAVLIAFAGCDVARPTAGIQGARGDAAAQARGTAAAKADVAAGLLKLKEYPPMPYSLQQMNFLKLLKSECGVSNEVVQGPIDSAATRQEVAAYNDVMRGEIRRRFGADIFEKLRDKADGK